MIRQAEQGSRNQLHDKMLIKGHKHAPCNLKIAGYITVNLYIPELIMKLWTQLNFNLLLMSKDIEYIRDLLKSGITSVFSLFTPVYTQRHSHFPKWFTGDIRHQINCLHTLRRKKATASHLIKSEGMETKLQEDIAIAKVGFDSDLVFECSCSNTSTIFQHLNDLSTHEDSASIATCGSCDHRSSCWWNELIFYFLSISKIHLSLCLSPMNRISNT